MERKKALGRKAEMKAKRLNQYEEAQWQVRKGVSPGRRLKESDDPLA